VGGSNEPPRSVILIRASIGRERGLKTKYDVGAQMRLAV
jgi:hypothetical protein